jgi:hypothetical protein
MTSKKTDILDANARALLAFGTMVIAAVLVYWVFFRV